MLTWPLDRALAAVESNTGSVHGLSVALTYAMMGRRNDAIKIFEEALLSSAVPFIALGVLAGDLTLDHAQFESHLQSASPPADRACTLGACAPARAVTSR